MFFYKPKCYQEYFYWISTCDTILFIFNFFDPLKSKQKQNKKVESTVYTVSNTIWIGDGNQLIKKHVDIGLSNIAISNVHN